jgi:hypothetical protein
MLIAAAALGTGGCASRQPIQARYATELEQLRRGMTVQEFRRVLPRARLGQAVFAGGRHQDIYRLDHRYKPDDLPAETQTLYFFFDGDRLVRWGTTRW